MNRLTYIIFTVLLMLVSGFSSGQQITKLTITDDLASSSKFGYGKPKPAAPKERFTILPDKGTQVLVYLDLVPKDTLKAGSYSVKFIAYKTDAGKEEWVDDRVLDVKNGSKYALTAFNFFDPGKYKVVVTGSDEKNILSHGEFIIER